MKLTVEIDMKKLKYSYEFGTSKAYGDMPLNTDGFLFLASLLSQIRAYEKFQAEMNIAAKKRFRRLNMKPEEAKLRQFVRVDLVGKIIGLNSYGITLEIDNPAMSVTQKDSITLPWCVVEPMSQAELRELDDPTIINGA